MLRTAPHQAAWLDGGELFGALTFVSCTANCSQVLCCLLHHGEVWEVFVDRTLYNNINDDINATSTTQQQLAQQARHAGAMSQNGLNVLGIMST